MDPNEKRTQILFSQHIQPLSSAPITEKEIRKVSDNLQRFFHSKNNLHRQSSPKIVQNDWTFIAGSEWAEITPGRNFYFSTDEDRITCHTDREEHSSDGTLHAPSLEQRESIFCRHDRCHDISIMSHVDHHNVMIVITTWDDMHSRVPPCLLRPPEPELTPIKVRILHENSSPTLHLKIEPDPKSTGGRWRKRVDQSRFTESIATSGLSSKSPGLQVL